MTEIPFNIEATNKLFKLDFKNAIVADIKELMYQGADIRTKKVGYLDEENYSEENILDYAIQAENVPVAAFLLAHGVRPTTEQQNMCLRELSFLIENKLKTVDNPMTEYSKVVHNNSCFSNEYLSLLEKHGTDLNRQDKDGKTPLMHLVCSGGCKSCIADVLYTVMVRYDYDYTLQDNFGRNLFSLTKEHRIEDDHSDKGRPAKIVELLGQKTLEAYKNKSKITLVSNRLHSGQKER